MRKPNVQSLLTKLAAREQAFVDREFLAAKLQGIDVNVRIAGAICRLRTLPRRYEGFGVFKAKSHSEAVFVREATLAERSQYLSLLPRVRLIVQGRRVLHWIGRAANQADARFRIDGVLPIQFAFDVQAFDIVFARFDGVRFWFEELDMSQSPMTAAALRNAMDARVNPRELRVSATTPELREAYAEIYRDRWEPAPAVADSPGNEVDPKAGASVPSEADVVRDRLKSNLTHAGAELVDYAEHVDGFRVTYKVDGRQHVSSIDKSDLTVQSAGFCLDELDRDFDLASLVSVVREGHNDGMLYEH